MSSVSFIWQLLFARTEINLCFHFLHSWIPELDYAFKTVWFDWLIVPQRDILLVIEVALTRITKMKPQKMIHLVYEKGT
jgi:hypothetical protein